MTGEFVRASRLFDVESRTPIAHPATQATDRDVRKAIETTERELVTDGGTCRDDTDREVYWGKPADARKPHLFDGDTRAMSLCRNWGFYTTYADEPVNLSDPQPGYDLDDLCVKCREKARSLRTGTDRSDGGRR
ncbi:hypothetical protein [Halovivax cerinus]|uniref:Uncharacterized protein n=1 Tax=Halovivax cerinus TaxID=1487865 RepID=A0ABD5NTJ6_9EURY|nr:hypothetical protein [Halovivax cerinus]